jgi:hypothetical protein
MTKYAIRIHDRFSEDEALIGTVMRSNQDMEIWHDVATGHLDDCWEILNALAFFKENS